ncbi:MAG: enoyl-CoA hydratase/isomerase family protein [Chloroflexi bacterium]|nr:enoyl-CoA hydratase/isomerase family protein [Chloroflexota bacterium]
MLHTTVDLQKKHGFAVVTLREHLITSAVAADIRQVCDAIRQDDGVRAAVLTGTEGNFCRGTDWTELAALERDGELTPEQIAGLFTAARAIASIEKPVMAAIGGDAFGQGLELALACDIRLASATAKFGFSPETMPSFPFDGATQLLPRLIGKSRALEMLIVGETIDAPTALRWGLIGQIAGDINREAEALAAKVAAGAPISLRFAKEAIIKGLDLTLDQGLRLEGDLYFLMHTTSDRTEGIRAFREKRKPQFKGE